MTAAPDPRPRLAGRLRLARAALTWERLWPAVWPLLGIARACSSAVALLDLLPGMPGWLHVAALALFRAGLCGRRNPGVAGAARVRRLARRGLPPGAASKSSTGLRHRPSSARGQAQRSARRRKRGVVGGASASDGRRGAPIARRLAARPGWRGATLGACARCCIVLLIRAVVDAGPDWRDRIARALPAKFAGGTGVAVATSLDVWLTPPEYTGLPPQFLRAGTRPIRCVCRSAARCSPRCMAGAIAPRLTIDRRQPRLRPRSTSRISAPRRPCGRHGIERQPGRHHPRQMADRDRPGQSAGNRLRAAAKADRPRRLAPRLPAPATITASRASRR